MGEERRPDEKQFRSKRKNFLGYSLPTDPLTISLIVMFAVLAYVVTSFIQIPVPATGGYINIGDLIVMVTALLFGPIIGCLAGGIGSAMADVYSPYIIYAPGTLVIKGLEGLIIGIIADPKKKKSRLDQRDILAVIIGGLIIIPGYFIYEAYILGLGVELALIEVPGNLFQFLFAAIGSILLIGASRKNITEGIPQVFDKIFIIED